MIAKRADSPYRVDAGPDWVLVAHRVDSGGTGVDTAAAAAGRAGVVRVGRAKLTNPTKVLYPLTGTTKSDVLEHYLAVAEVMLPHLRDRAVTLVRWPDGVEKSSFFEKDVSRHAPAWIRTARVGTPGGRSENADFPVIDDVEGLAWAANLAALELHVPQWRLGPRRRPPAARPARVRPRPRRGHDGRGLRPGGRADRRPARRGRPARLPAHQRRQGHAAVPAGHGDPAGAHLGVRQGARRGAGPRDPGAGHRGDGEGPPARQGVRRLEPEQPAQDDDRELLAARAGPPDRGHPGDLGRGARLPPARGPGVHRGRPAGAASPSTATCSPRCSASRSGCPVAADRRRLPGWARARPHTRTSTGPTRGPTRTAAGTSTSWPAARTRWPRSAAPSRRVSATWSWTCTSAADGVPVVHHDPVLGRTTDGAGLIGARTAAELAAVRVRGREPMPRLEQVLDRAAGHPDHRRAQVRRRRRAGAGGAGAHRQLASGVPGQLPRRLAGRARRLAGPRLCTSLGQASAFGLRSRAWLDGLPCAPAPRLPGAAGDRQPGPAAAPFRAAHGGRRRRCCGRRTRPGGRCTCGP